MKANNGRGNNSLRDGWQTPQDLFDQLHNQYHFMLDCCATRENKKCEFYTNDFESCERFNDTAWMNPPFSIAWRMFEHFFKAVNKGVAIYRCDNFETGIWQKVIFPSCDWVFVPSKRVSYEGIEGEGARFPSALIGIGVDFPINIHGTILLIKKRA